MTEEVERAGQLEEVRTKHLQSSSDLFYGVVVAGIFTVHIVWVVLAASPFWLMCFIPPLGSLLWPIIAVVLGVRMFARAQRGNVIQHRGRLRVGLALLLIAFAADSVTGGDYRWFEWGMRRKLQQCGGAAALQAWAQNALESPPYSTQDHGDVIYFETLPPQPQHFLLSLAGGGNRTALYSLNGNRERFFYFDTGGYDMGWGVVVGKKDLTNPAAGCGIPQLHQWIKKMEPGIYIFAKY